MPVTVATADDLAALQARVAKLEAGQPSPPPAAGVQAMVGINTHLGWTGPYSNIPQAIAALKYLGVRLVRDSCTGPATIPIWQQVAAAIPGLKFCDYMPEGSPALCQAALALVPQLSAAKLLVYVEGPNESDDDYAASQGMTMAWAAQFQRQVFAAGKAAGLSIINLSFGAGWTADNNWQGDYGAVGDLGPWCNYANAHTYFVGNVPPDDTIRRIGGLARLAAKSRPVITTEFGYTTDQVPDENQRAGYIVAAINAAFAANHAGCWVYSLYDDHDAQSGKFGLFNDDGSPRASATAIRNLMLGQ